MACRAAFHSQDCYPCHWPHSLPGRILLACLCITRFLDPSNTRDESRRACLRGFGPWGWYQPSALRCADGADSAAQHKDEDLHQRRVGGGVPAGHPRGKLVKSSVAGVQHLLGPNRTDCAGTGAWLWTYVPPQMLGRLVSAGLHSGVALPSLPHEAG